MILAGRTGEDFYLAVPVNGMTDNVLKIQAARANPDQAATETRSVLVPAVPEQFQYDLDGNLTQDGLWNYEWDGENRLKAQELRPEVTTNTWKRIENVYDSQSRRVQKVVKTRSNPTAEWVILSDTRYLYDGWNLIAEYSYASGTFTALRSHAWGLDLSGTPQGAGGVGGLLWTKVISTAKTYAAGADANGNVVVYVDCSNGAVAGRRDYGPFGEAVVTTGVAGALPYGFSSKFEDKETGYYYYGFRYYNPSTGRWLSRDPLYDVKHRHPELVGEGPNLYALVGNNAVNQWDYLGLIAGGRGNGSVPDPRKYIDRAKAVCDGYGSDSKCYRNGVEADTYPGRAKQICRDFIEKYRASRRVLGVARCLIAEETKCRNKTCCAERNACRLEAHVKCYAQYAFIDPFNPIGPGFPDGGPELGWEELLPDYLDTHPGSNYYNGLPSGTTFF